MWPQINRLSRQRRVLFPTVYQLVSGTAGFGTGKGFWGRLARLHLAQLRLTMSAGSVRPAMAQAPALAFLDWNLCADPPRPRPDAAHRGQRTAALMQSGLVREILSLDFGLEAGRALHRSGQNL
jgi:hypothetical protein